MRILAGSLKVLALAVLCSGNAWAAGNTAPQPFIATVRYDFTFAGLPFGYTRYEGRFERGTYAAQARFETSGLISVFWQALIDASAAGRYRADAMEPASYKSLYRRGRDHKQEVDIAFGGAVPVTTALPPYDMSANPVSDAQKKSGLDPLSAVTFIAMGLKADAQNPCGSVAPVYDGRRRYDIQFHYLKDIPGKFPEAPSSRAVHYCQIRYVQIAGFKQKILREGKTWPPIYGYFAEIPDAATPRGFYLIALKLWARTDWGTVQARLTAQDIRTALPASPLQQR